MVERFAACPDHLHAQLPVRPTAIVIRRLEAEADEMWSFVGKKANTPWLLDRHGREDAPGHGV
jgi:hypothetical protein